jgi:hypothetical protein
VRGYMMPSALTETAMARKSEHPKGIQRHYTFRTGAGNSLCPENLVGCNPPGRT